MKRNLPPSITWVGATPHQCPEAVANILLVDFIVTHGRKDGYARPIVRFFDQVYALSGQLSHGFLYTPNQWGQAVLAIQDGNLFKAGELGYPIGPSLGRAIESVEFVPRDERVKLGRKIAEPKIPKGGRRGLFGTLPKQQEARG